MKCFTSLAEQILLGHAGIREVEGDTEFVSYIMTANLSCSLALTLCCPRPLCCGAWRGF
jgi:hypothetical protein